MNIKETLEKYTRIALVCNTFDDVKTLLRQLRLEQIRHTYYLYQEEWEDMFDKYTSHLDSNFRTAILIVEEKTGYNLYSRSYKDWGKYDDWENYHFIDYTAFIREDKLNQLV